MKKFLIIAVALVLSVTASAQESENSVSGYVAAGLSVGNAFDTTFAYSSYPSIEIGMMKGNWALGAAFGRSNNVYSQADDISNYWYELKTAVYFPIGKSDFDGYALFGIGNYMSTNRIFIEYGGGFSYSWNNFGVFTQVSNWDGGWYVTPGIGYSF